MSILDMLGWGIGFFWWGIGYGTARLILPIVSFGGLRAAPLCVSDHEFNWLCCRRSGNGPIEVESTVAGFVGLLIFFVCLAVFLHFL